MVLKVRIETHGCKLNMADSQRLAREFIAAGFQVTDDNSSGETPQCDGGRDTRTNGGSQADGGSPDVYILNSCTVTHVADRKARHALAVARRAHPRALIVASGCYAERAPELLQALDGVDLVVTNREKPELVDRVARRLGIESTPCADGTARNGESLLGRTRAFIKIQEGCDQVCAYCIVPKVRGRERSIPPDELVRQVRQAETEGLREVVLTGTQLGSYGFDLERINLAGMIRRLLIETDIPRIRVSSLQPPEMTDELIGLWSQEGRGRLCPHFHMPLQSGSDSILLRMRRRYDASEYLDAVTRARQAAPGASVTADVIAGFPGETVDDFAATVEVMRKAGFASAHVFPYSARPGTSAAHFKGHLAPEVRAERAAKLRQMAETDARTFRESQLGTVREVLWETDKPVPSGLTDNYLRVVLAGDGRDLTQRQTVAALPRIGEIIRTNKIELVRLVAVEGERVLARPI